MNVAVPEEALMNRRGLKKGYIGLYDLSRKITAAEGLAPKWAMRGIYQAMKLGRIPAIKAMRKWQVPETFKWTRYMHLPGDQQ